VTPSTSATRSATGEPLADLGIFLDRLGARTCHERRSNLHDETVQQIRVLIADDHPVVRRGVAALLSSLDGVEVVGEAANGEDAVREAQLCRPDVVIMDVQMPGLDGIEATRRLARAVPEVFVLMLTMFEDDETVFGAVQAGARGYLLKGAGQAEILAALQSVVAGQLVVGPEVARRLVKRIGVGAVVPQAFPELTARELEILDLIAQGKNNTAIAVQLGVAVKTVGNHISAVFAKLRVASRAEAIVLAREGGLGRTP
jgi:DNA-binding NarL/FixJ family response regulator